VVRGGKIEQTLISDEKGKGTRTTKGQRRHNKEDAKI